MNSKTYILVLNFNGYIDTIECLESIFKLNYSNFEIVLVDNFSIDNSLVKLNKWLNLIYDSVNLINETSLIYKSEKELPILNFIKSNKNLGYSGGNNLGINYCLSKNDFDFIWILNNDTIVEKESLISLIKKSDYYQKNNLNVGIIGSKVIYYNSNIIQCMGGCFYSHFKTSPVGFQNGQNSLELNINETTNLDYILGASMFVTKEFIEDAGLLSEDYFLYFEEIDWLYNARKIFNWQIGYTSSSIVYHKEGQSTKSDKNKISPFADYHYFSSRILFTKKFAKKYLIIAYFLLLFNILKRTLKGNFSNSIALINVILKPK